jgi:hypothetical protein
MSPCGQETGLWAGCKHNRQEANGKKESRERRALVEFHADLASDRSCEVNTAREVFRLPARDVRELSKGKYGEVSTYYET